MGPFSPTAELRALRERAGLSMETMAQALKFKGASSYQRYEDPELFRKPHLPLDLTKRLLRILVHRGEPPIRAAEVLRLAGVTEDLMGEDLPPSELDRRALARVFTGDIDSTARMVTVQELDVRVSAGGGSFVEVESERAAWGFPWGWVRHDLRLPPGDGWTLEVVTAAGDSMADTIEHGDKVLVNKSDRSPSPPGVFALWDGVATVVKRLEIVPGSTPPKVRVISDNPHYPAYERAPDEIQIIGRVVARIHAL